MPFSCIPEDVIGEIFSFAASSPKDVTRYSQVSARWRDAAASSSTLWSQDYLVEHHWNFRDGVPGLLLRSQTSHVVQTVEVLCGPTSLTAIHLEGLNIRTIGNGLFKGSPNLTKCTLHNLPLLQSIGDSFLAGSYQLAEVDLRGLDAVEKIGDGFLEGCAALIAFDASGFGSVSTMGRNFLRDCTSLVSFSSKGLEAVSIVDDFFLCGCRSLIEFDGSGFGNVLSLKESFMMGCSSLRSFECSGFGRLREITHHFLKNCTSLKSFDSTGITQLQLIGNWFCQDCSSLVDIEISAFRTVKEFDFGLFSGCDQLDELARKRLSELSSTRRPTFADDPAAITWPGDVMAAPEMDLIDAVQQDFRFRSDPELIESLQDISTMPVPEGSPLSPSQAAAIRVFYKKYGFLNKQLRNGDVELLAPFLRLSLNALGILRDTTLHGTAAPRLYFGTQAQVSDEFRWFMTGAPLHRSCVWWLTADENRARAFAGESGIFLTFTNIRDAAPMVEFSSKPEEQPWFVLPGVHVQVKNLRTEGGLTVGEVEQVDGTAVPFPPSLSTMDPQQEQQEEEIIEAYEEHEEDYMEHHNGGFMAPLDVIFTESGHVHREDWTVPIVGIDDAPDVSIEEAVHMDSQLAGLLLADGPLVVLSDERIEAVPISRDQAIAISLYTGKKLYSPLNARLRNPQTRQDETLRPFLKLLLGGLGLLRDAAELKPEQLFRGIGSGADLELTQFIPGKVLFWWQFSSFSSSFEVAKRFIRGDSHLFFTLLKCEDIAPVAKVSQYIVEDEWILIPGVLLEVCAIIDHPSSGLVEVRMKQIGPPQVDFTPRAPAPTATHVTPEASEGVVDNDSFRPLEWQSSIDSTLSRDRSVEWRSSVDPSSFASMNQEN